MKYFTTIIISLLSLSVTGQNLLGKSKNQIVKYLKLDQGFPLKSEYTETGDEFISYYPKKGDSLLEGLSSEHYYLNSKNICYKCVLVFSGVYYLDDRVADIKKDINNIKIQNRFAFKNISKKYLIDFQVDYKKNYFSITFEKY